MAARAPWRIELRLPEITKLFSALDPSPFVGRDLNDDVEYYIIETARDAPSDAVLELIVEAPAPPTDVEAPPIEAAVRAYFAYLRDRQLKRVRRLMQDGRRALVWGLGFLAVCTVLAHAARTLLPGAIGDFFSEGLLIIGWVANWRPVEIFLYEWRPMAARARLLGRLSHMTVTLRAREGGAAHAPP
jgi:hypothetical protein